MSTISRAPRAAASRTSARISAWGREASAPRVYGTMQKVQWLSQPYWIVTNAETPRHAGSSSRTNG